MNNMTLDEIRVIVMQGAKYGVLDVRYGLPEKNDSPDHVYIILELPTLAGGSVKWPIAVRRSATREDVIGAMRIAHADMDDMIARGQNTGILPMWG